MTEWTYQPLWDAISHYDYPDGFEFGIGEDDDQVFDQAWAFMLTHNMPVVHFPGFVDPDKLEEACAILCRSRLPDEKASTEAVMAHVIHGDREAIFVDRAHAHIAAMMFGGEVLAG